METSLSSRQKGVRVPDARFEQDTMQGVVHASWEPSGQVMRLMDCRLGHITIITSTVVEAAELRKITQQSVCPLGS